MPQVGSRNDPYRGYNFKLTIQGITEAHFTECTGLGARIQPITYREGGAGEIVRQLPGPVEYKEVTLRYGLTDSSELFDWFMSVAAGQTERKSVSIAMLAEDGSTPVFQWDLHDAWPAEWRAAHLDAMGREVAIEALTLVYERLERS